MSREYVCCREPVAPIGEKPGSNNRRGGGQREAYPGFHRANVTRGHRAAKLYELQLRNENAFPGNNAAASSVRKCSPERKGRPRCRRTGHILTNPPDSRLADRPHRHDAGGMKRRRERLDDPLACCSNSVRRRTGDPMPPIQSEDGADEGNRPVTADPMPRLNADEPRRDRTSLEVSPGLYPGENS